MDFLGNEVKIGDYVAFTRNPYADMQLGKVVGFTNKGIKIVKRYKDGTWGGSQFYKKDYEVVFSYQYVKVEYSEEESN